VADLGVAEAATDAAPFM